MSVWHHFSWNGPQNPIQSSAPFLCSKRVLGAFYKIKCIMLLLEMDSVTEVAISEGTIAIHARLDTIVAFAFSGLYDGRTGSDRKLI